MSLLMSWRMAEKMNLSFMEFMGLYTIGTSEGQRSRDELPGRIQVEDTERTDRVGTRDERVHRSRTERRRPNESSRRSGVRQKYRPAACDVFPPAILV